MTTHAPPTSLSAFLLACLADEEAVALAAITQDGTSVYAKPGASGERLLTHVLRHDPARVLANVAALRAVIALHVGLHACDFFGPGNGPTNEPCPTLRALAQPFAGREGWQESWAL